LCWMAGWEVMFVTHFPLHAILLEAWRNKLTFLRILLTSHPRNQHPKLK
jgi:hypothetical protein